MLRSHKVKQQVWRYYGKRLPKERVELYKFCFPKNIPLDKLKQLGFYVDFINDDPMMPSIFFLHNQTVLKMAFKIASDRLKAFHPLHSKIAYSQEVIKDLNKIKVSIKLGDAAEKDFSEFFAEQLKKRTKTP